MNRYTRIKTSSSEDALPPRKPSSSHGPPSQKRNRTHSKTINFLVIFIFTIVLLEIYLIERNFIHHVSSNHELLPPPPPPPNYNPLTSIDAAKTTNNKLNPLEDILRKAQINITEDVRHSLPSFSDVQNLYGSEPIIIGLDKCADFRAAVKPEDSFIAPAGMFNTGTNLMSEFLQQNCFIPEKKKKKHSPGIRAQVPWGKHTPVALRGVNHAISGGDIDHSFVLPVLIIKDPYTWMQSMCRHEYSAGWFHKEDHCPNLIPYTQKEKENFPKEESVPINVHYSKENIVNYKSLVDLWNTWYTDWMESSFPFLAIRFEDLLFHSEDVVRQVCHCATGEMLHDNDGKGFQYIQESAKQGKVHSGSNGLLSALIKYGNTKLRKEQYLEEDLQFARQNLDSKLMEMFNYKTI